MTSIQTTLTLVAIDCGVCHVTFALEQAHLRGLEQDGSWFWCPNGHKIHYTDNENARLRREAERAKQQAEYARASRRAAQDQLEATQRSLAGHKAAKTRIKNRIARGVCPCCGRSFENLRRHMEGQHPHFVAASDE